MDSTSFVGIDLGTTNSLVAYFTEDGPALIANPLGRFLTPSAVALSDDGSLLIGQAAKDRLVSHPETSTARFKRYMGTNREIAFGKQKLRAEELSALVLKALKSDAEAYLGRPVNEAVISVPAYFNDV